MVGHDWTGIIDLGCFRLIGIEYYMDEKSIW